MREGISIFGIDLCRSVLDFVGGLGAIVVVVVVEVVVSSGGSTIEAGELEFRASISLLWLCRAALRRWRARVVDQPLGSSRKVLGRLGESTSRPIRSPVDFW